MVLFDNILDRFLKYEFLLFIWVIWLHLLQLLVSNKVIIIQILDQLSSWPDEHWLVMRMPVFFRRCFLPIFQVVGRLIFLFLIFPFFYTFWSLQSFKYISFIYFTIFFFFIHLFRRFVHYEVAIPNQQIILLYIVLALIYINL